MTELDQIKARTKPDNIFLVCDAMAGQDTVRTAAEFNRRLDISGFIMTKMDGDARGGAALSIKEITGKPIKFLGQGEGLDKLERFRPEGLASRILGMGDIVGLMQDFEQVVDERQAERDTKKLLRGEFTLQDFLQQLKMIQKVGSMKDIYEKFPIFGDSLPEGASLDDGMFVAMESLINSMTPAERAKPSIIDDSRAKRIARGSGRKPEDVKDLVQRFGMMHGLMQNLVAQPGLLGNLPGFKQLGALRKLKGMNMNDVLGDMGLGGGKGMPGMPGMPMGGMPGMPGGGLPGLGGGVPAGMGGAAGAPGGMPLPPGGLPPGVSLQQYQNFLKARMGQMQPRQVSAADRQKSKDKRKAEKKARKKSRR
jgi:signal recognition particle subunit SRP54